MQSPIFSDKLINNTTDAEDLYKCVHCGLCLSSCPTYLVTGLETESPRGRIALMTAIHEDRAVLSPQIIPHMELCLQCRACEAVCPSGVPFGRLMETTREQIYVQKKEPLLRRLILNVVFHHVLPYPRRLYFIGGFLRIFQRLGMIQIMRKIPGKIGQLHTQLPSLSGNFFKPSKESFKPKGKPKFRVGLLSGCVMPMTHGSTMEAAIRVLVKNKCEVVVPEAQVCCGALNLHGGDKEQAKKMAKLNLRVFSEANIDAIIVTSAGCGSTMKEYHDLLKDDSEYSDIAKVMSEKVKDISEFLVELPLDPPKGNLGISVTYQDPCHLAHAQRITDAPRQLLRSIPGVNLIEMNSVGTCCGAAGLYSTLQPEMSLTLQRKKVESVIQSNCEIMATGNPGCAIQLKNGLASVGSEVQVKHVVDLLDQSYNA